ncbi:hypothetical protein SKAU_G00368920 [Synaphobranchus kaupii]|uniref:Calpain-5 n=1 Tax=Synaphobranchus kaupii TaxID=118154 RepID=A0A9Q1EFN7_SYNKA|nr:hypothetical protein SKAU_G00368920 [Synaphobranchus kaupii]
MANGLVKGHAYSVTAIRKVRLGHGLSALLDPEKIFLIRMRNPWGKTEWKGTWSDSSEEWERVGSTERTTLGLTVKNDGEFWYAFLYLFENDEVDDWCTIFTDVDVCRLINTSLLSIQKTWHEAVFFSSWTKDAEPLHNRSGGCVNNRNTFLQNPQFVFDISKDEDEVLISIQQQDMKMHRPVGQGKNFYIGFSVFKVELNRNYRMHKLITQRSEATSTYTSTQDLGEFMIRVYTDVNSSCRELTQDKPKVTCWVLCLGYPQVVTQIYVHGANGLQSQDGDGGANPYVIIYCEGNSAQSTVQNNTLDPVFDTRALFYRKNPRKPITVQVWSSCTLQDQFLGQVVLRASQKDLAEPQKMQLHKRGQETRDEMPGTITLKVVTSSQLTAM